MIPPIDLSEDEICILFIGHLEDLKRMNLLDFMYLHIPNEISSNKNPFFGKKLKRMGKINGAADYLIAWEGGYGFIEFKTQKGKQNDSQKQFEKDCKAMNIKYEIARSVSDGIKILRDWGLLKLVNFNIC